MHEKYTTKAFVVSFRNSKEADRIISMYTYEFGLISVLFTGVRQGHSKFKGFLEVGNVCFVTLVKGKSIWRGTDVVACQQKPIPKTNKVSFLRSLLLIQKLVIGAEKNIDLFETLDALMVCLEKRIYTREMLEAIECIAAMRILSSLGYGSQFNQNISGSGPISETDILQALEHKFELIKNINKALAESHL
jgi:recombinational DNA repair protein (RecF pathway)